MSSILDPAFYLPKVLKIQTKTEGLRPFRLMDYQKAYLEHMKNDFSDGIIRSIVLKARQCGFSTLAAGININRMCTQYDYKVMMLADKSSRTEDVFSIYRRFVYNLPGQLKPMLDKENERELYFDNPNPNDRDRKPGLESGLKAETALDQYAGRSGTRKGAHMTEAAFYRYGHDIEEGVGNSIPIAKGTYVLWESTANGMSGTGEHFYNLWQAAERGDTVYKPFFVSWFDVDNYIAPVPHGTILTKYEIDLMQRCPKITIPNIVWRRLKIREYSSDGTFLTPEERFCRDFPSYPEEAFISTGRPVFCATTLKRHIDLIKRNPPPGANIKIMQKHLSAYPHMLKVFFTPAVGKKYVIGADISEGLIEGDFSHAKIIEVESMKEVAFFHGRLDPDIFGKVLVELAKIYNNAHLVPEKNNMGIATLIAIKAEGYMNIYVQKIEDQIESYKEGPKLGFQTNVKTKQQMLNALIAHYRDGIIQILDIDTLREMLLLSREDDGSVSINGRDRVAALCLAIMGTMRSFEKATVFDPNKQEKLIFETYDKSREKILKGKV